MNPDHPYDTETEHPSAVPVDPVQGIHRDADREAHALADPAKSMASLTELMYAGLAVPSPFMKDVFLVRQAIVGTRYLGGSDELVDDLKPGSCVTFIAEPDNRFDENAVMALDEQGRKLGYIPRHENSIIGALLKAGKGIYGIVPEDQPGGGTANGHTPYSIWVDLYMREFVLPDDITQIPRQGYQGSYAVIAMELEEDEKDNDYMDEAVRNNAAIRSISAIKVINGEEKDIFIGQAAKNTMEEQRKLLHRFHMFSGYLPLVGHDIGGRVIPVLAESYGVLLRIPFSNRVIDTKVMALNHLPGRHNYTLDALSEHLGIAVKTDSELETICRKTWKLYCRMERSDL